MKKLMIALLCMSMQMWGFTIVKIGDKTVKGNIGSRGEQRSIIYLHSFTLKNNLDRYYVSGGYTIKLMDPEQPSIKIEKITSNPREQESPFTLFFIHADTDPITFSWHIDKDGSLMAQYKAKETAVKTAFDRAIKGLEEEKNEQIKQLIHASLKSAGEREGKAAASAKA